MNTADKSLELAKLMGWDIAIGTEIGYKGLPCVKVFPNAIFHRLLCPYKESEDGYTQSMAILLKFPEVMVKVFDASSTSRAWPHLETMDGDSVKPTQSNLMDELLRLKGIEI